MKKKKGSTTKLTKGEKMLYGTAFLCLITTMVLKIFCGASVGNLSMNVEKLKYDISEQEKKIESLNNEEFLIDTKLGMLFVKGKELEMQQLDTDNGNLWISGTINLIEYIETTKKQKSGFLGKVFK